MITMFFTAQGYSGDAGDFWPPTTAALWHLHKSDSDSAELRQIQKDPN